MYWLHHCSNLFSDWPDYWGCSLPRYWILRNILSSRKSWSALLTFILVDGCTKSIWLLVLQLFPIWSSCCQEHWRASWWEQFEAGHLTSNTCFYFLLFWSCVTRIECGRCCILPVSDWWYSSLHGGTRKSRHLHGSLHDVSMMVLNLLSWSVAEHLFGQW